MKCEACGQWHDVADCPTLSEKMAKSAHASCSASLPVGPPIILTQADYNLCMGSGELLRCPFCGDQPMSHGETIAGKAIRWTIQCTGTRRGSIIPDCFASVIGVDADQTKARAEAVRRWNRRVPNERLSNGGPSDE